MSDASDCVTCACARLERRLGLTRRSLSVFLVGHRDKTLREQLLRAAELVLRVIDFDACALDVCLQTGNARLRLFNLRIDTDGSSRAITCPLRTFELKSACSDWIVPDTCEPTCTVVTAWSVPVASTVSTTSPREAVAVMNCGVWSEPVVR